MKIQDYEGCYGKPKTQNAAAEVAWDYFIIGADRQYSLLPARPLNRPGPSQIQRVGEVGDRLFGRGGHPSAGPAVGLKAGFPAGLSFLGVDWHQIKTPAARVEGMQGAAAQ
jgi:hypothetical protein